MKMEPIVTFNLRLTKSAHELIKQAAKQKSVSLQDFILTALEEKLLREGVSDAKDQS